MKSPAVRRFHLRLMILGPFGTPGHALILADDLRIDSVFQRARAVFACA